MDTQLKLFVFSETIPETTKKGVIYIIPSGGNNVNIFKSLSDYQKTVNNIEENDFTRNIFIARGDIYSSSLEFRIMHPTIPRDCIFIKTEESLNSIIKGMEKDDIVTYDIFSGNDISALDLEEEMAVKKEMKLMFYIMLQFMSAGYHEQKNKKKLPDWCVCFTEPIMKYFIQYFEIKTECEDINIQDQFLTNPQFREMITIQMLKLLSNYVVNNNFIETKEVTSWLSMNLWLSIKSKF